MKHVFRFTCMAAMAGAMALGVAGTAAADPSGLEVGAEAPDFTLTGHDGQSYKLSELCQDQMVAIVFHRSADW